MAPAPRSHGAPHPKKLRKAGPERASTPLPVPSRVPPPPAPSARTQGQRCRRHGGAGGGGGRGERPERGGAEGPGSEPAEMGADSAASHCGPRGPGPGAEPPGPPLPSGPGSCLELPPLLGSVTSVLCFFGVFWWFWGFLHTLTRGDPLTVTPTPRPRGLPQTRSPLTPPFWGRLLKAPPDFASANSPPTHTGVPKPSRFLAVGLLVGGEGPGGRQQPALPSACSEPPDCFTNHKRIPSAAAGQEPTPLPLRCRSHLGDPSLCHPEINRAAPQPRPPGSPGQGRRRGWEGGMGPPMMANGAAASASALGNCPQGPVMGHVQPSCFTWVAPGTGAGLEAWGRVWWHEGLRMVARGDEGGGTEGTPHVGPVPQGHPAAMPEPRQCLRGSLTAHGSCSQACGLSRAETSRRSQVIPSSFSI